MSTSMEKMLKKRSTELYEMRVAIPENITASLDGAMLMVKGPKGEVAKDLSYPVIDIAKAGNEIVVSTASEAKKDLAVVHAFVAHIQNMMKGVTDGFRYKLKIVYSHFPITTKVAGNIVEISNFLGEKSPRKSAIVGKVKIIAGKEEITVEGINIEEVGQTAANLELATRVLNRDTRIFQDGIYIVSRE